MILSDYFLAKENIGWHYAKQVGVENAVFRFPEDDGFDITDKTHWKTIYDRFVNFGIKPILLEPMPNCVHDHIKCADEFRDESIEKVIKMFTIMDEFDIRTICFNFMAHIGWLRTSGTVPERGGALVTGFDINDFVSDNYSISEKELWDNYTYFIKAVIPYAEKHGIKLALHPDDPPISKLGNVSRIMTSFEQINKAVHIVESDNLGVTFCQATYVAMGENLYDVIPAFAKENKIFFIHFRDISAADKFHFHETFHDNGITNMGEIIKLYQQHGCNVPVRVDHVPSMYGENNDIPGYAAVGRLFAIGYLKGLLENS